MLLSLITAGLDGSHQGLCTEHRGWSHPEPARAHLLCWSLEPSVFGLTLRAGREVTGEGEAGEEWSLVHGFLLLCLQELF